MVLCCSNVDQTRTPEIKVENYTLTGPRELKLVLYF